MKRLLVIVIAVMGIVPCSFSRDVININRGWEFSLNHIISSQSRTRVDLPHTWNHDANMVYRDYYRGVANYTRNVNVPSSWRSKRVYIRFNGVNSEAGLLVNGHYVGAHKGGYTAFAFEITEHLKYGTSNSLWVRVNNSPQLDYMPVNGSFNAYGGIYRDVELIVVDPAHISLSDHGSDGIYVKQTKVTREKANVDATVIIDGANSTGNYTLSVDVKRPESGVVVTSRDTRVRLDKNTAKINIPLEIDNPVLWNGMRDAYLYDVSFKLRNEKVVIVDSLSTHMGLRYYSVSSTDGFSLNGEKYQLRGVTYYGDRAGCGAAMRKRDFDEDIDMILEMGANAVRMTNYPSDPYFFDLCDRYGIVVWTEIPLVGQDMGTYNGYVNSPYFKDNCKMQLTEMVKQNINRPSVMFWGIFSDLVVRDDNPVDFVKDLNDLVHSIDPTRLTAASSNQDGAINFITDVIGWSQYLGWKSGHVGDVEVWLQQLTARWGKLKSAVGEYGAGGSLTHVGDTLRRPGLRERVHPERWQADYHEKYYAITSRYPSLWGTFVNSMFDYGSIGYITGDSPGVSDIGLVTYDRRDKKDAFYFYKANWNNVEPFVHIADKRWDYRRSLSQTVRVYSNQSEVELVINGRSLGAKLGRNGVFTWSGVRFNRGENVLEANSGRVFDQCQIVVNANL